MQVTLKELVHEYPTHNGPVFKTAEDVYTETKNMHDCSKEIFTVFYLNCKNRVIARETVSVGIIDASLIHPREVFRTAVHVNAHAIVITHNHPSGDKTPSSNDKEVTELLTKAGEILGIKILDHLIVTTNGYTSFAENGLLPK